MTLQSSINNEECACGVAARYPLASHNDSKRACTDCYITSLHADLQQLADLVQQRDAELYACDMQCRNHGAELLQLKVDYLTAITHNEDGVLDSMGSSTAAALMRELVTAGKMVWVNEGVGRRCFARWKPVPES